MRRSLSVARPIGSDNPEQDPDRGHSPRLRSSGCGGGGLSGVETKDLSPKVQVAMALSVLAPVVLSRLLLVAFATSFWWILTTYGWVAFPAFGRLWPG